MMTKPRQVIMEVYKWTSEREEANLYTDKILNSICTTLDGDPGNTRIQHLQSNFPPLRTMIADLTDKIGVEYFTFDSHTPPSPAQKKKSNYPATLTPPRKRRVIDTMRQFYLSPYDTITLCGGLTEVLNGGKICHNPSSMAKQYPVK